MTSDLSQHADGGATVDTAYARTGMRPCAPQGRPAPPSSPARRLSPARTRAHTALSRRPADISRIRDPRQRGRDSPSPGEELSRPVRAGAQHLPPAPQQEVRFIVPFLLFLAIPPSRRSGSQIGNLLLHPLRTQRSAENTSRLGPCLPLLNAAAACCPRHCQRACSPIAKQ
ncbi:hypothetical protein C8Q77DRAFT_351714 [Trametes polyzona]|nr:hypothetical protein C8Q77DRAFT_351714 [Trametes polyzona]